MRAFRVWLLSALLSLGGFAGCYHFYLDANPRRLLVIVDSSTPMRPDWERVQPLLDQLTTRRYTQFALATQRDMLSVWSSHLTLGSLRRPTGERDFSRLIAADNHLPLNDVNDVILITNDDDVSATLPLPASWQQLAP